MTIHGPSPFSPKFDCEIDLSSNSDIVVSATYISDGIVPTDGGYLLLEDYNKNKCVFKYGSATISEDTLTFVIPDGVLSWGVSNFYADPAYPLSPTDTVVGFIRRTITAADWNNIISDINSKQDTLIAGEFISIVDSVISADLSSKQDVLTAGTNIYIDNNVISAQLDWPISGDTETFYLSSISGTSPVSGHTSLSLSDVPETPILIPYELTSTDVYVTRTIDFTSPSTGWIISKDARYRVTLPLTNLRLNGTYEIYCLLHYGSTNIASGQLSFVRISDPQNVPIGLPTKLIGDSDISVPAGDVITLDISIKRTSTVSHTAYISSSRSNPAVVERTGGAVNANNVYDTVDDQFVSQAIINAQLLSHVDDLTNPHDVTKEQIGLGDVDNTSDVDKPISTAQQTALDNKAPLLTVTTHIADTDNPHDVTPSQLGVESGAQVNVIESVKVGGSPLSITSKAVDINNVPSATKLNTSRTIDGISFDGTATVRRYGVCSTARGTSAKTVSLTGYTLDTGAIVVVKFTNGNVAESPTLNVTSTGAYQITYKGSEVSPEQLEVGGIYTFVYDGTNYEMIGNLFDDTSNIEVHGFIVDESNSDPQTCITYIGSSVGMSYAERLAKFLEINPPCVVYGAERSFYVDPTNWALRADGVTSSGVSDGLSLVGNFVREYKTYWYRATPLGTDIHMIEFCWQDPGRGNGWVCCHWRNGTIRRYIWEGVTEGYVDSGKLRAIFSDSLTPTTSLTNEAFRTAAQATGTAEGLSGDDNTYTITQPLPYIMRIIWMYWTYGTLDLQTDVARGIVDDTSSVVGKRPVAYGVSLTGGDTQGTPASSQSYTENISAVVNGIINPYGNVWEHMIDFAYRFSEIAMALDGADHFDITTLTTANWDDIIPNVWARVYGVDTVSGYIRKMLWAAQFPFVSKSTVGGSSLTGWADYTYRNSEDTIENKVPRCCLSGGAWYSASRAGPASLPLDSAVGRSDGTVGARLQIFSKE